MELAAWKPVLSALILPPVPALVLILVGARLIQPKRGWGYFILFLGVLSIWFSGCNVTALWLQNGVLKPPAPMVGAEMQRLKDLGKGSGGYGANRLAGRLGIKPLAPKTAIVVLGGGREALAREYGVSDLSTHSSERLRYGVWLSRQTGLPMAFSGGIGWAQQQEGGGSPEADVAARVAQQQYGWTIHWTESHSSDTKGNAMLTVAMLAQEGVSEIVLVTEAFHMPRAKRAFERAVAQSSITHADWPTPRITPAPMGYWSAGDRTVLDWMPSAEGLTNVRLALHEVLGLSLGL
ncbi:MAG: YdcF family protein [Burkholderiales bacterium]|nr:YdcF family protein [Burkholderiales bacterium]